MQNLRKNILIDIVRLVGEWGQKSYQSLRGLILDEDTGGSGRLMSLLHHIIRVGPAGFRKYPTAITLGKSLFSPLVFLFPPKNPHEYTRKD